MLVLLIICHGPLLAVLMRLLTLMKGKVRVIDGSQADLLIGFRFMNLWTLDLLAALMLRLIKEIIGKLFGEGLIEEFVILLGKLLFLRFLSSIFPE